MADLAPEDVRRLAASLSLPLTGGDGAEITHRLNAFLDALATLDALPLEQLDQIGPLTRTVEDAALIPAAAVHRAARTRALIREQVLAALAKFDLLLAPTSPHPAPAIASHTAPVTSKEDAASRFFGRRSYTTPASLAGVPAISVPCGFTAGGLPIGLQLIGRPFAEATVLGAAHAWEKTAGLASRRLPLAAAGAVL